MAKLENLFPNFLLLSPVLQEMAFNTYSQRRQQDLFNPIKFVKKTPRKATATTIQLTEDEKKLMKLMGLKQRDLLALRESITVVEEEDENEDEEEVEVE